MTAVQAKFGAINITPDALSRYFIDSEFADKHPHRSLRIRLFRKLIERFQFTLDGMAADDGHNALLPSFCCPSMPFFEQVLSEEIVWLFPPAEMAVIVIKFVANLHKAGKFKGAVLLAAGALKLCSKYLALAKKVHSWPIGSDLFREWINNEWVSVANARIPHSVFGFGL